MSGRQKRSSRRALQLRLAPTPTIFVRIPSRYLYTQVYIYTMKNTYQGRRGNAVQGTEGKRDL